jgi:hypothetical protein
MIDRDVSAIRGIMFALLISGVVYGFVAATIWLAVLLTPNRCPQEDSCYPEYDKNGWHIVEGQRP